MPTRTISLCDEIWRTPDHSPGLGHPRRAHGFTLENEGFKPWLILARALQLAPLKLQEEEPRLERCQLGSTYVGSTRRKQDTCVWASDHPLWKDAKKSGVTC
eukprot:975409-Pelagomonas_calceolata.AAC.3